MTHLHFRTMIAGGTVLVAAALSGCQTTKTATVTEVVERRIEVPKSLLNCTDEPQAGTVWIRQRDVARYLVKLAEAGEDCRVKLAAVKRLVEAS